MCTVPASMSTLQSPSALTSLLEFRRVDVASALPLTYCFVMTRSVTFPLRILYGRETFSPHWYTHGRDAFSRPTEPEILKVSLKNSIMRSGWSLPLDWGSVTVQSWILTPLPTC